MSNARLSRFKEFARDQKADHKFWYAVYRQLDQHGLFPPGMDDLSVASAPCRITMGSGYGNEGPTIQAVIKKIAAAYDRELDKRWTASKED